MMTICVAVLESPDKKDLLVFVEPSSSAIILAYKVMRERSRKNK